MEIKFFIEPIFKIEFFKIQCVDFENKREQIEKLFEQYPEIRLENFYSNRNKSNMSWELQEVFKDEFNLISTKSNLFVGSLYIVILLFPAILYLLLVWGNCTPTIIMLYPAN